MRGDRTSAVHVLSFPNMFFAVVFFFVVFVWFLPVCFLVFLKHFKSSTQ